MNDVGQAARRFGTIDGINSDDNQIAVLHLSKQGHDGWISRVATVPIWFAVNLYGGKLVRHAR